jgi:hypothetical protein
VKNITQPIAVVLSALLLSASWASAGLKLSAVEILPRLDLRAKAGQPIAETLRVQQGELGLRFSVDNGEKEWASFALQGVVETPMTGRARQMHFSNFYTVANLGVGKPKVKLGQFVVPFGTLAEFDTHALLLQTPYAHTVGLRLDRGVALEGFVDDWDYWLSVTSGNGRNRHNGSYATNLRVARDQDLGDDFVRVGFSYLEGKHMPTFPTSPMAVPMGMDGMVTFSDKRRLAVDVDWLRGIDNIRAELVLGQDDGKWVDGQWLYYNHPFSYETDLTLQADRWRQEDGTSYGLGAEIHHRLDDWSGLRFSYEHRGARPTIAPLRSADLWTVQYYREYVWALDF